MSTVYLNNVSFQFWRKIRRPKSEVTKSFWSNLIESINYFFRSVKQGKPSLAKFKEMIKNCWIKTSLHGLAYFLLVTLNATPMLMHSSSTQQLDLYDIQKDSMNCCLTKLKIIFHAYNSFILRVFVKSFKLLVHSVNF